MESSRSRELRPEPPGHDYRRAEEHEEEDFKGGHLSGAMQLDVGLPLVGTPVSERNGTATSAGPTSTD